MLKVASYLVKARLQSHEISKEISTNFVNSKLAAFHITRHKHNLLIAADTLSIICRHSITLFKK